MALRHESARICVISAIMADLTRAVSFWRGGKPAEAEQEILAVLRTAPDDAAALEFLGDIYGSSERKPQAIAIWRRLAELRPGDAGVLRRLAQALMAERAIPEAIEIQRRAIALEPENARAHNNLGLALLRSGDAAAAVPALERAVAIDPAYALGHLNLGVARQTLGDLEGARANYERALQIDPYLTQARAQLSQLLREVDSAASRREADRALESLAVNLMTMRRHEEAIAVWTQLIERRAAINYLEGTRFHCQLHCCDWSGYEERAARIETGVLAGERIDLPFSFFVHSNSPQAQLQCAQVFIADRHPAVALPAPVSEPPDSRRIKVAYLSFDFYEHATAYLIAGLFESHDRQRFEITALSYGLNDRSAMRGRLEASVERFVDVSRLSEREIGELMRSLGIQIAVDLKGLTGGARTGIFAGRAAPVQVNFLGYPGSMGAPYIDYLVADRHVVPAPDQIHYREKIITLPRCYQPNDSRRPLPAEAPGRAELGLPERGFVFCCFNNLYKITPGIFAVWMNLLRAIEGSVLWLFEGNNVAMHNLRAAAAARGIDPARILFAPHIELAQHLARYRRADLFLDTTPCNAHTTASDALWMGVPVLTVTGRTFAGRVATSLLHAVGLERLCTESLEEYEAVARRLARAPADLAELKVHLERGRRSFALFDTASYCRDLEAAYVEVWARHERGEPPAALMVAS